MLIQGQWIYESELITIPYVNKANYQALIIELKKNDKLNSLSVDSLSGFKYATTHYKSLVEDSLVNVFESKNVQSIIKHIQSLPWINVYMTVIDPENGDQIKIDFNSSKAIDLEPNKEYEFLVSLNRKSCDDKLSVHSKKFPKKKDESWFVCIAYDEELIAIKRTVIHKKSNLSFNITMPQTHGFSYRIYILSDSYLGLDQQYDILIRMK